MFRVQHRYAAADHAAAPGSDGKPHLPGSLDVWKNLFVNHPAGQVRRQAHASRAGWKDADDVLEALFGLCRKAVENEPLKIFMALSDVERNRAKPLEASHRGSPGARISRRSARSIRCSPKRPRFPTRPSSRSWTPPTRIDQIRDLALRADAAGTMQALVGLWQIFVRAGHPSPRSRCGRALARLLEPFAKIQNERDVFDGGPRGRASCCSQPPIRPRTFPRRTA